MKEFIEVGEQQGIAGVFEKQDFRGAARFTYEGEHPFRIRVDLYSGKLLLAKFDNEAARDKELRRIVNAATK